MDVQAAEAFILEKLRRELPAERTYHSLEHTLDVTRSAALIAASESVNGEEAGLLHVAALYHDSGFTEQDTRHEEAGCIIARRELPRFGFSDTQIEDICAMIMATRIPQSPHDKLSRILCDADLDYLGREDFFEIGETLFDELRAYGVLRTEREWNELQLSFLSEHHYFTPTNERRREPLKQQHLDRVKTWLAINK